MNELDFSTELNRILDRAKNHEIKAHLASYHFKISKYILDERVSLGLSVKEAAQKLHMNEDDYRKFENGFKYDASENAYKVVLLKLKSLRPYINL